VSDGKFWHIKCPGCGKAIFRWQDEPPESATCGHCGTVVPGPEPDTVLHELVFTDREARPAKWQTRCGRTDVPLEQAMSPLPGGYYQGIALTAAMPVIERAVLREAAQRILLLDAIQRNVICPRCHTKTVGRPRTHLSAEPYRCAEGHEWPQPPNRGPYNYEDSSLRLLARGEPLPDLPPKEGPRA